MNKIEHQGIPFIKYSLNGNNFVLLDEIQQKNFSERDFIDFAYTAIDHHFGIGADNLIVIQSNTKSTVSAINSERKYWRSLPDAKNAKYIFRMFEPDGSEAYCCGNALMCIADYLFKKNNESMVNILTEIPSYRPTTLTVGVNELTKESWIKFHAPRKLPPNLYGGPPLKKLKKEIQYIELEIMIDNQPITLPSYIVFTGEPHLVIFTNQIPYQKNGLHDIIFNLRPPNNHVEKLARYILSKYKKTFPYEININFAKIDKRSVAIEQRTYERCINRETYACGTGAMAIAYIAKSLFWEEIQTLKIIPHLSILAEMPPLRLEHKNDEWILYGTAKQLFNGNFTTNALCRN